jgi:3'-phosphoadenosine 5'-phosphosulfate sulfotransferase (PAPS reductase)/FAD synthetase
MTPEPEPGALAEIAGRRIVCRFSCGAASAVATKLALSKYRHHDVVIHYSDTRSEHRDNERFLADCEAWFGRKVERLYSDRYYDIWDVWARRRMLVSGRTGFAPCTEELKRMTAEIAQRPNDVLILGYTAEEQKRLDRTRVRNPQETIEAPLIDAGLSKSDCYAIIQRAGIALPEMYALGFKNNNCLGCPRGGMGYWNNIRRHFPDVFARMAALERDVGTAIIPDGKTGKRIFLDELDPNRGDQATEPNIECSIMCHAAEEDLAA